MATRSDGGGTVALRVLSVATSTSSKVSSRTREGADGTVSVRATTFVGGLPRDADGVGRGREAVGERKNRQSEANHSIERTIPNPVLGDGATCECLEAPRAPFLGKSGHNVVRMNSLHPRDEALVYRLLPPRLGEYTGGGPLRIFFFFLG